MPAAAAASLGDHCCSRTRCTNRARIVGVVFALRVRPMVLGPSDCPRSSVLGPANASANGQGRTKHPGRTRDQGPGRTRDQGRTKSPRPKDKGLVKPSSVARRRAPVGRGWSSLLTHACHEPRARWSATVRTDAGAARVGRRVRSRPRASGRRRRCPPRWSAPRGAARPVARPGP